MSTIITDHRSTGFPPAERGPLTRSRLYRTTTIYLIAVATGALLLAVGNAPLQAFGVGLWFPGAGFLAVGGWYWLLTGLTLILFGLSLVAWFGAGATSFPPFVWLASAGLAAALASPEISKSGVAVAITIAVLSIAAQAIRKTLQRAQALRIRRERIAYLPSQQIIARERTTPAPAPDERELTPDMLAALRWLFDRALQDADDFSNFDKIDQFQTSAIRYQINQIAFGLAQVSFHYTPAFGGYSHVAQNRLVEKYLERVVWGYWRWENAWGRLSLDADPAKTDNIMLTGYLGLQVNNSAAATGEHRWYEPGALSFRTKGGKVYRHDGHTLLDQLMRNFRSQHFTLWPCEPNWIYPACNFRGAMAIRSYDRLFGTRNWDDISDAFRQRLETEFTNPNGSVVALRSRATGFAVPFPMPDAVLPQLLNPLFPDMAERYWATTLKESFENVDGVMRAKHPARGVDFGNYRMSFVTNVAPLVNAAAEMGDAEAANAALTKLNEVCEPVREDGVMFYKGVSNLWNSWIAQDRTAFRDAWRSTILDKPPACITEGPQLAAASYPEVLVASARNDGSTLTAVVHPGAAPGRQKLGVARLIPGMRYTVSDGHRDYEIVAGQDGTTDVDVDLRGRLELVVTPTA